MRSTDHLLVDGPASGRILTFPYGRLQMRYAAMPLVSVSSAFIPEVVVYHRNRVRAGRNVYYVASVTMNPDACLESIWSAILAADPADQARIRETNHLRCKACGGFSADACHLGEGSPNYHPWE